MNRKASIPLAFLFVVGIALAMIPSSCLGPRVKPASLFPPLALTWPAIEEDLVRGVADGVEDQELSQDAANALNTQALALGRAIEARDLEGVRVIPWTNLEPWVERGIADKVTDEEIGPGVGASLREQLSNFGEAIAILQETY